MLIEQQFFESQTISWTLDKQLTKEGMTKNKRKTSLSATLEESKFRLSFYIYFSASTT